MPKKLMLAFITTLALAGCGTTVADQPAQPAASTTAAETATPASSATPSATPTQTPSSSPSATETPTKPTTKPTTTPSSEAAPKLAYDEVQVSSLWVRAMDKSIAMNGSFMTAAFMAITNLSDADITLTGAKASFAADGQIHEVVNGMMKLKPGGLLIKAGTTELLQSGGVHLMFVGMPAKLLAGDEVTFTLLFNGGRSLQVTAPVKLTNAGAESYKPAA